MKQAGVSSQDIGQRAAEHGLVIRGGFCIEPADAIADVREGVVSDVLVLFGQVGSSVWSCFSGSADCRGSPHRRSCL